MHAISFLAVGLLSLLVNASPTLVRRSETNGSPTIEKRTVRTSNPGGCLEVQGTNPTSTQYKTVASAVAALGSATATKCIFIWPGTYKEQVTVQYGGPLSIYGYTTE
jgi:pectinesterase